MTSSYPDRPPVQLTDEELATYQEANRGAGWLFFAGTILGLAGLMRILDSIWAFRYDGAIPDNLKDGVLGSNLDTYAWTWLIVGVIPARIEFPRD
jgi:hypothetical protein